MKYRSALIIPVADQLTANQAAVDAGIAVALDTFSVELVPVGGDDDATSTHYGCSGILTDVQQNALVAVPNMLWYRWGGPSGAVSASYDGSHLTETPWNWAKSIAALGLKVRVIAP